METSTSRLNLSNIIAACIVAGGLVTSARIVAQRPLASTSPPSLVTVQSARPLESPPLSQETIREQVRTQVLQSPDLQTYTYEKVAYKLSDAIIAQVSYTAKDDTFLVGLEWAWQPAMPSDGPHYTYLTLGNNGYNEYTGTVTIGEWATAKSATIRVK
ncbi:MAG: hypothetical protein QM758_06170 [Armatimonas sp.]